MHQNREKRREYAKLLGLMKKKQKASSKEWLEITSNAIQAGKKIHKAFEESTFNAIRDQLAEIDDRVVKGLMEPKRGKPVITFVKGKKIINPGKVIKEGMLRKDALKILEDNKKIEEARNERLMKRRVRRAEKNKMKNETLHN